MKQADINALIISIVKQMYAQYPMCEWEDLVSKGWLIVTEKIGDYDPNHNKQASLRTYLARTLQYELSDYIRREVLHELNMNGHRIHAEHYDAELDDCTRRYEAKDMLSQIMEEQDDVSRDILNLLKEGYTQRDTASMLGITEGYVSRIVKRIRKEWKDV